MAPTYLAYATFLAILLTQTQCRIVQFDASLIDHTCKQTPNYDECLKFLNSDPRSLSADVKGLALILVDQLKSETTKSVEFIKQIRGKRPELEKPLNDCDKRYEVILTADIPVAIEALEQGNPKFAEGGMNDATVEANSCEEGFQARKSPLTDYNKLLNDISHIASSIVRLLL